MFVNDKTVPILQNTQSLDGGGPNLEDPKVPGEVFFC